MHVALHATVNTFEFTCRITCCNVQLSCFKKKMNDVEMNASESLQRTMFTHMHVALNVTVNMSEFTSCITGCNAQLSGFKKKMMLK